MFSTHHSRLLVYRCTLTALAVLAVVGLGACGDSESSSPATSNGTTATSNGTTATSNGTTATSNGTTSTSNGTTATSNGTTATSNGTTATSNGTTVNMDPSLSQCGGFAPRPNVDVDAEEACAQCVDDACCDETMACGDDPECLALRECFVACGKIPTRECNDACSEMYEGALELNSPFIMCRNSNCLDVCPATVDWTCVGSPEAPPEVEPADITLNLTLVDFQSSAPAGGVDAKFCAADDINCDTPLATGTSDAEGLLSVTIDRGTTGFDGYIEMTGAGRFPTLGYFNLPQVDDFVGTYSIVSESTLGAFAALLGIEFSPEHGHAAITMLTCSGVRAPGASFGAEGGGDEVQEGYIDGGLPSPAAMLTDTSGVGGLFNIMPGEPTFFGTREKDGVRLFEKKLIVKAGYLTTIVTAPRL